MAVRHARTGPRLRSMSEQLDLLAGLAPDAAPAPGEPLVSRPAWGRLRRQDPVKVRGLRGDFVFWAHVTNLATGDEWISAYGGRKGGVRQFRSVEPERVRARRPARAGRRAGDPDPERPEQPALDLRD